MQNATQGDVNRMLSSEDTALQAVAQTAIKLVHLQRLTCHRYCGTVSIVRISYLRLPTMITTMTTAIPIKMAIICKNESFNILVMPPK